MILFYKTLLNTLQKIKIYNSKIDKDNIYELITSINFKNFNLYIQNIKQSKLLDAINILDDISNSGVSVIDILFEFFYYIKNENTNIDDMVKYNIIQIISRYIIIFNNVHEDNIELAFFTNDLFTLFNPS